MTSIDTAFLDQLLLMAAQSPRRRQHFDLRNSSDDTSQRMLNALLPDTDVPIHRHRTTSETVVVLRGAVREVFYDATGRMTEEYLLQAGHCMAVNVPMGQWHTVVPLEPSVILECKDGAYTPLAEEDRLTTADAGASHTSEESAANSVGSTAVAQSYNAAVATFRTYAIFRDIDSTDGSNIYTLRSQQHPEVWRVGNGLLCRGAELVSVEAGGSVELYPGVQMHLSVLPDGSRLFRVDNNLFVSTDVRHNDVLQRMARGCNIFPDCGPILNFYNERD